MSQHLFTEKIYNKRVVLYQTESGIRIVVGRNKMFFEQLEASIKIYIDAFINLKKCKNIKFTQSKMNFGIRILICDYSCSVGLAFRLYNEIVEKFKLENQKYSKLYYELDLATEISPS